MIVRMIENVVILIDEEIRQARISGFPKVKVVKLANAKRTTIKANFTSYKAKDQRVQEKPQADEKLP